jgi:hypothetical protein
MLVPTRGRPENSRRLLAACEATCVLPDTRIVFGVDEDDRSSATYNDFLDHGDRGYVMTTAAGAGPGMVGALNQMCHSRLGSPDVIGFLGDDHLPRTVGWDKALCDALSGKPAALAYGNDLLQGERIPTAVAMTASIPRVLGYMAPPQLAHLYVDNVWLDWGRGLGTITYLPDVVIEHLHPVAGKAPQDAGYEAVNAPAVWAADQAAYTAYRDSPTGLAADLAKLKALT